MFRLEKLEINGFKSFADKTILVFGEGITGVVGPNGCGKSNVAEAISWVLGEQSAKNLRGGKMEDVIFNGTRDRKPTGLAEVLLTMVATEDIAAHEVEDEATEEQEFDEALNAAQRAAETASDLVNELASPTTSPEHDSTGRVPQAAPPASEDEGSIGAASVEGSSAVANLELNPPGDDATPLTQDSTAEAEETKPDKQPKRKRTQRPPRRRRIALAAGERIVVGRRLYRTGDSEYLINGKACLLRDIQDLFAGTGLGGAHYAIIEQGRIGQILSSKPLDRRALIEEAAGITKFKSRKRATELRLESAKQNLTRLNDIISEVERQVNSLKRQAQKARRYRRLRDEMRAAQKIVFTADFYRLNETADRIGQSLKEAEELQRTLEVQLHDSEGAHRTASTEARAAEDSLAGLRERHAAVELEADRARNRRAFEEQQLSELNARVQEIDRDQKQLDERMSLIQTAVEQRASSVRQIETELTSEQTELRQREAAFQEQTARVRDAEATIEQLRHRMLQEVGNTERLRNLGASLEEASQRVSQRHSSLAAESQRAGDRLGEVTEEHQRLLGEMDRDAATLAALNTSIAAHASSLAETRSQSIEVRDRHERAERERAEAEHRMRSLEDLDAHRAYYSDAVQQVLAPELASSINALGTLADFVEVEPQYERLVESLFSRELQCVLVPTIDDALAGVDYIKSQSLGRGGFLVVGLHGGEGEPPDHAEGGPRDASYGEGSSEESDFGVIPNVFEASPYVPIARQLNPAEPVPDFLLEPPRPVTWPPVNHAQGQRPLRFELEVLRAVELLGLRPELKSVVERAFPDRCSAAVVPDIEAALQLSIENSSRIYVTSEGEQVVNGRLIVTGAQAGQQGTSLLGLKRELKALRVKVEALRIEAAASGLECGVVYESLAALEAEAAILDGRQREHEREATARRSRFDSVSDELERSRQHVRVVDAEVAQTGAEREELDSRLREVIVELVSAEASREFVRSSLEASQLALAGMRSDLERLAEELSQTRSSVAALTERLSATRAELRRLETEAEELRSRINRNRLELYDSHGRIEQLVASLSEGENSVARLESDRQQLAMQITESAEGLTSARARADELELALAELRQSVSTAHDQRGHIEIEKARTQSESEHLSKLCLSELGMSLDDVVTSVELQRGQWSEPGKDAGAETHPDVEGVAEPPVSSSTAELSNEASRSSESESMEKARERLDEIRAKLDDIGPVNMMALEELEESEERFKFLSTQRSDILESIRMTEEALNEIKRRSRERFRHAFHHINENFQRMFVELFGGGRGEMILIDEDDVLESGIDLIAQPPAKRLQNVLLLSGGEKAMAAIALVLAIFQYRPSPFCILDEVDAPLDEMNVGRFSDKVIEMSRETQFLVITHNKRTMEAARALYGVTMEEPGVSKLVSVKFE